MRLGPLYNNWWFYLLGLESVWFLDFVLDVTFHLFLMSLFILDVLDEV